MSLKFYNPVHPDYKTAYFTELGNNDYHYCRYIYCYRSRVWKCNYCEYTTHRPSIHCGRHYQTYHEIKSAHVAEIIGSQGHFTAIVIYDKRAKRLNKIERIGNFIAV